MTLYSFQFNFKLDTTIGLSEDAISQILEFCEEKAHNLISKKYSGKLLAFTIEADVTVENNFVKALLEINVIISPLSPLVMQEEKIAEYAANVFINCFQKRLRKHGEKNYEERRASNPKGIPGKNT
ncbi:MAG: hypothetical protein ACTSVA_09500 [Candidatus Njordarchaeales archaeon]